jgi:hypothetical protein
MTLEEQNGFPNNSCLGAMRVRMMDYMVHFKTDAHRLEFEVYPVQDWKNLLTSKEGTSYIDKENEPDEREIFEEGKCLKKLEGSFCWRGVWEGRLYFSDDEYWGEDIVELSELYSDHIEKWCKDFIKEREPSNHYDD